GKIMVFPDAAWSRRVRGTYGNDLATRAPDQAHAILTPNRQGGYTVSVRSPLATMHGADRLCRLFPGGGGRAAAAGINHLPHDKLPAFINAFKQAFQMGLRNT
ncbi:MAG TPA: acetyltransferase, partial [Burkholderiaceae bacterium]|nr:acetyltransferase [Burkholderiaceae bacterium]